MIPATARRLSRRSDLARHAGHVFSAAVEITNICNLKCGFCPNQTIAPALKKTISPGDFERIVTKLHALYRDSGKKRMIFSPSGLGEVFLVPDIDEYLGAARAFLPGATIDIASNFTCIKESVARIIIEENLVDNLTCSLNYSNRQVYSDICGRDTQPNVIEALDMVTALMREHNSQINLYISMKNTPSTTAQEKKAFEKTAADRWGSVARVCWGEVMNWGSHLDLSSFNVNPSARLEFPCFSLFHLKLFINGEGDIYPCCCCTGAPGGSKSLLLGNVHDSSWRSIRRKYGKIRDTHLKGEWNSLPMCAECNIYTARELNLFFKIGNRYY